MVNYTQAAQNTRQGKMIPRYDMLHVIQAHTSHSTPFLGTTLYPCMPRTKKPSRGPSNSPRTEWPQNVSRGRTRAACMWLWQDIGEGTKSPQRPCKSLVDYEKSPGQDPGDTGHQRWFSFHQQYLSQIHSGPTRNRAKMIASIVIHHFFNYFMSFLNSFC